jgi:hypothetical protein
MSLAKADKIPRAKARALILDLARHGDNSHRIPSTEPDAPIIAWFEQNGEPFDALVEKVRDPTTQVPFVENLVGPNFTVATDARGNTGMAITSPLTGQSVPITGPGTFSFSSYHSAFDAAMKSLDRAIQDNSYQDLMQAITSGFASLDAFIAEQIAQWNYANPQAKLEEPPFRRFEEKIADWFPKMTNGKVYDRGRADWSILKKLREIRDDFAAHPQQAVYAVDFAKMAKLINDFPRGIAETLFQFHVYFGKRVPCSIIRARCAPDVYVP